MKGAANLLEAGTALGARRRQGWILYRWPASVRRQNQVLFRVSCCSWK